MRALVLAILLVLPSYAQAASFTLVWTAPAVYEDGSPMATSTITSYTIYWDTVSPPVANQTVLYISPSWPSQSTMTYVLTGLSPGTSYFVAVTATNSNGEGVSGNVASKGSIGRGRHRSGGGF